MGFPLLDPQLSLREVAPLVQALRFLDFRFVFFVGHGAEIGGKRLIISIFIESQRGKNAQFYHKI